MCVCVGTHMCAFTCPPPLVYVCTDARADITPSHQVHKNIPGPSPEPAPPRPGLGPRACCVQCPLHGPRAACGPWARGRPNPICSLPGELPRQGLGHVGCAPLGRAPNTKNISPGGQPVTKIAWPSILEALTSLSGQPSESPPPQQKPIDGAP